MGMLSNDKQSINTKSPPFTGHDSMYSRYTETLPNGRQYHILEESDSETFDNTPVHYVPQGHFFSLGDNRDHSNDSRNLKILGYIPLENLMGRLMFTYWNSRTKELRFLE
jgi:signal peptidase I